MQNKYPELTSCQICPRKCGIDRNIKSGYCQASDKLKINLAQLHFGEEPVISGKQGSGTIFFSHCNLRCVYCQNHTISWLGWGNEVSEDDFMSIMFALQEQGAHNINLVTPSHYSLQLVDILHKVKHMGLTIPIVWNSNAYESVETLKQLEGLVDIYLPDLKYASAESGALYSDAMDYPEVARLALLEMKRQVGLLDYDADGIAKKGMIVRMLALPNGIAGIEDNLRFIKKELGKDTFISLLAQYYPNWKATDIVKLNRGITQNEYDQVLLTMDTLGLDNGFKQEISCSSEWTPEFKQN
jgi:putative pyruvate formate lyase activating enzyme